MNTPSPSESEVQPAPVAPARPRRIRLFALVAVLALTADIVSKCIVVANISPTDEIRLIGGALVLVQARNSGAAFSLGTGMTVLLTLVALAVALVIVRAASRLRSAGWAVALGLVLGGALGNLVDRFFRAPSPGKGHVVDWITVFPNNHWTFPTFNLADSCITIGGCLAVLMSLRNIDLQGRRGGEAEPERPADG